VRILLVAPSVMPLGLDRYGGVELLVSTMSEALTKAGHFVTVAAPEGSRLPDGVRYIPTVQLPTWQDRDDVSENIIKLSVGHGREDFDVIHDFSHKNTFKDRAIHMVWNPVSVRYPSTADNRQVTFSRWQAERFKRTYGQESRVMPMWVDTDRMKPLEGATRERLLYFGAITPAKGALLAIDLAKRLGVDLDVAGGLIPSELDSPYLKTVREKCDGEHIRLHFNVSEEEKRTLIQNAKAVVYPVQQAEAHWLTGMEAWCAGTPTLAMGLGAMREITKRSWGVVAETPEEFSYYMKRFDDPEFRKTFDG
jgi:glycosyltransferase involved in cell wall biosynthesis